MKTTAALLAIALMLMASGTSAQNSTGDHLESRIEAQVKRYEEQARQAAAHQALVEEQEKVNRIARERFHNKQRAENPARVAAYAAAIQKAVTENWRRPASVPIGKKCRVLVTQIRGGEIARIEILPDCPYDMAGRASVEDAVRAAGTLPYTGYEDIYQPHITISFDAQEDPVNKSSNTLHRIGD